MLFYKNEFIKLKQEYNDKLEENIKLNNSIEKLKIELAAVSDEKNRLLKKLGEIEINEKNKYVVEKQNETIVDTVTSTYSEDKHLEEISRNTHKNQKNDIRLTYEIILEEGFEKGFIDAKQIRNIDFKNEKVVADYYEAIEELENKGIKINY